MQTTISRVPFPLCHSGAIGLAIGGNAKNEGHLSPWQEVVRQDINSGPRKNGYANEATLAVHSAAS